MLPGSREPRRGSSGHQRQRPGERERTREEWDLRNVPLGYDLDVETMRQWGLYVSEGTNESEPAHFNEPGLFLVSPDQTLYYSAITNMPFGRPKLEELISGIDFVVRQNPPAARWCLTDSHVERHVRVWLRPLDGVTPVARAVPGRNRWRCAPLRDDVSHGEPVPVPDHRPRQLGEPLLPGRAPNPWCGWRTGARAARRRTHRSTRSRRSAAVRGDAPEPAHPVVANGSSALARSVRTLARTLVPSAVCSRATSSPSVCTRETSSPLV
ncbi:hypothetical protein SAMN04487904_108123 [Actinopolyspora lacussalsi subsp. righensis]|uniref:AhpC/TSA family protein n=1 Tax=Actinopolyspora righensis TaxID=995060 RepID=A0A1I7AV69_9ACTN|nr:hypothetical protein SAMN04487904_108123 [Actinopolyspora righensis]